MLLLAKSLQEIGKGQPLTYSQSQIDDAATTVQNWGSSACASPGG